MKEEKEFTAVSEQRASCRQIATFCRASLAGLVLLSFSVSGCVKEFPDFFLFDAILIDKTRHCGFSDPDHCVFITATKYLGDFSSNSDLSNGDIYGIDEGDRACMRDANYPGFGVYQVLMADQELREPALGNWLMKPNTLYKRTDGVETFVTNNQAIIDFTGGATLMNPISDDASATWWTGLDKLDWSEQTNCGTWKVTSGNGFAGKGGVTDGTSVSNGLGDPCGVARSFVCIEQ